jgi:hypothetical protein
VKSGSNVKVRDPCTITALVYHAYVLALSVASFSSCSPTKIWTFRQTATRSRDSRHAGQFFLFATSTTGPKNSIYSITRTFTLRGRSRQQTETSSRLPPRLCRKRSVFPLFPFSCTHQAQRETGNYPCDPLEGLPPI